MDAHALKGAKIAWLGDWGLPFDDGIMDISERAVEDLRALGADVTAIDAPFSMDALWHLGSHCAHGWWPVAQAYFTTIQKSVIC